MWAVGVNASLMNTFPVVTGLRGGTAETSREQAGVHTIEGSVDPRVPSLKLGRWETGGLQASSAVA